MYALFPDTSRVNTWLAYIQAHLLSSRHLVISSVFVVVVVVVINFISPLHGNTKYKKYRVYIQRHFLRTNMKTLKVH